MTQKTSIILSLGFLIILASCKKSSQNNAKETPPVPISTFKAEPRKVIIYNEFPGTVTAMKEVELRGQVTGYITGIFFTEGAPVRHGQKLYEIDRRQYEAEWKKASDNLKIAQENLAKVQLDVDRYITLKNQEAIARQLYDHAVTDLANAKLQVSVANQEMVQAKTNLDFSVISAPFDGTVGLSQVKMGDLITPGQTVLNTISSDDPMGFDFVISQKDLRRFQGIQLNDPPDVPDSTFRLEMPDNSFYPEYGKVGVIDRAIDPQTGTIRVRLIFQNAGRMLKPGMNCNMRVMSVSPSPVITVPYKAVVEQMGEYFVFVVSRSKVSEVKVALGSRIGSEVVVESGLKSGDLIAVDGIGKLRDGAEISLPDDARTGNKSKNAGFSKQ